MTSEQLTASIAGKNPDAICSLSMGKDSIGAAIQMNRYIENVEYVFMYNVPGLEFQEISLNYYEHKLGKKILRMPHPSIYRQLAYYMYQSPENVDAIFESNLYLCTYDEVFACAKHDFGISYDAYVGVGVRSSDSMMRRASIKQTGGVNHNRKQFFPVHDWDIKKLVSEIRQEGIKLPIDYKIWGRSFDGFDYRFMKPLKDNFPRDYEKIKEWFPLVDVDLNRFNDYGKKEQQ